MWRPAWREAARVLCAAALIAPLVPRLGGLARDLLRAVHQLVAAANPPQDAQVAVKSSVADEERVVRAGDVDMQLKAWCHIVLVQHVEKYDS